MSGFLAKLAAKLGSKIANALNIGFLGYEVGEVFDKDPPANNITTTIIQRVPQEDNTTHMWIIIGFFVAVTLIGFCTLAIKLILNNRAPTQNQMIELNQVNRPQNIVRDL